jgi:hypothetical protein
MSEFPAKQEDVLVAIRRVAELCMASMPDAAVEYALREVRAIELIVEEHWPLTAGEKEQIGLGVFAVRNLDDWNPVLATALMRLTSSLRRDGQSLERIFDPA